MHGTHNPCLVEIQDSPSSQKLSLRSVVVFPHSEISHVLIFYMKDEFGPDLFEGAIEFGFVIL